MDCDCFCKVGTPVVQTQAPSCTTPQPCYAVRSLAALPEALQDAWRSVQVIALDEAQFIPDLLEGVTASVDGGRRWIIAGLDGDFQRRPIGQVTRGVGEDDFGFIWMRMARYVSAQRDWLTGSKALYSIKKSYTRTHSISRFAPPNASHRCWT